jgi:hypothetical protein
MKITYKSFLNPLKNKLFVVKNKFYSSIPTNNLLEISQDIIEESTQDNKYGGVFGFFNYYIDSITDYFSGVYTRAAKAFTIKEIMLKEQRRQEMIQYKELKRLYDIEYQIELKGYWEYVNKLQKEKDDIAASERLVAEALKKRIEEDPWYEYTQYLHLNTYVGFDIETKIYNFSFGIFKVVFDFWYDTGQGIFSNYNIAREFCNLENLGFFSIIYEQEFLESIGCFFCFIFLTMAFVEGFWYIQAASIIYFRDLYWYLFTIFASKKRKAKYFNALRPYNYKFKRKEIKEKYSLWKIELTRSHFEISSIIEYMIEEDPEEALMVLEILTDGIDLARVHTMSFFSAIHELSAEYNTKRDLTYSELLDFESSSHLDDLLYEDEVEITKSLARFKGVKNYQIAMALTIEKKKRRYLEILEKQQFEYTNPDISLFSEDVNQNFLDEFDEEDAEYISKIMSNQILNEINKTKV